MINQGTIFQESIVIFKFFLVGIFFALIYYILLAFKLVLIRDSFSIKFKDKHLKKEYKRCKNPLFLKTDKRREIKNRILEFLLDIIYFVIITPMMAVFLFGFNNGKVRWYIFLAVLIGFFIYKLILGNISLLLTEYLIFYFLLLYSITFSILCKPIKKILKRLKPRKRVKNNKQENKMVLYAYGKSRR